MTSNEVAYRRSAHHPPSSPPLLCHYARSACPCPFCPCPRARSWLPPCSAISLALPAPRPCPRPCFACPCPCPFCPSPALSALAPTHGLGRRPDLPFHSLCLPAPAPSLCLPLPLPLVLAAALLCRYALPAARALALSPYEYVLCIMYM